VNNNTTRSTVDITTYEALAAVAGLLAREHLVYWELGAFADLPATNNTIKKPTNAKS
jgi:hypothetical protein